MRFLSTQRLAAGVFGLSALALCAGLASASSAAAPAPPKTVKTTLIKRVPNTLSPGTAVSSSTLGQRVFVDATHGFALAAVGEAQYPAATTDGGATWKTDGPALHLNAAQAPLAVTSIGATSRQTIFAFGTGQAVDTTSDGGAKWYRALFQGAVMAVVRGFGHQLVTFVDTGNPSSPVWQYVSKNGGRTWSYSTRVGG